MKKIPKHTYLGLVLSVAIALHAYESFIGWRGTVEGNPAPFLLMLFIWALTPYAPLVVVATVFRQPLLANGVATVALLLDLAMHQAVFTSSHSTAAIGLLVQPFWNLLLALLALGISAWVAKARGAASRAP